MNLRIVTSIVGTIIAMSALYRRLILALFAHISRVNTGKFFPNDRGIETNFCAGCVA